MRRAHPISQALFEKHVLSFRLRKRSALPGVAYLVNLHEGGTSLHLASLSSVCPQRASLDCWSFQTAQAAATTGSRAAAAVVAPSTAARPAATMALRLLAVRTSLTSETVKSEHTGKPATSGLQRARSASDTKASMLSEMQKYITMLLERRSCG